MTEEINFTANGIEFTVGEVPFGPLTGKFVWSTKDDESKPFATAVEAQQDALSYASEEEDSDWREEEDERRYERGVRL